MTTTTTIDVSADAPSPVATRSAEALAQRLLEALLAGAELLSVHVGQELDLYGALRKGPLTAAELAVARGLDERYVREWLEQQTTAGLLDVEDPAVDPDERRHSLPSAFAQVLLDGDDESYLGTAALCLAGLALRVPDVLTAFRTGAGVPYSRYGREIRQGLEGLNRPGFVHSVESWVAQLPDVVQRLVRGGRVLDLGCGTGSSAVALAAAFPASEVEGVDLDEASIAAARDRASRAGVADRVTFRTGDAAAHARDGVDLVTIFEALHDMGDPIGALSTAHASLAEGGAVLLADELVADRFTPQADAAERLQYAWSVLHCLPATRAEDHEVAHGTVLRTPTVREWARQAGFRRVDVLDVEHDFWRFYRLSA